MQRVPQALSSLQRPLQRQIDHVSSETMSRHQDQDTLTLGERLARASTTLVLGLGEASERRFTRSRVHALVLQHLPP